MSNDMAYIFGLWFSSGTIINGSIFNISLRKKDKYILKKVAEILNYKEDLIDAKNKQLVSINLLNKEICDDIMNLCEIESLPKQVFPDFIRGYFDGKGEVIELKNKSLNTVFFCKNKDFADSLLKILKQEAGIQSGSFDKKSFSLHFGKRDSLRLGFYIYQNNSELFLSRKKQKFFKEEK